jgi:PAS domain S-box-containing protein
MTTVLFAIDDETEQKLFLDVIRSRLWGHPFVLLADWTEYHRIDEIVKDHTSDFAIRDSEYRHIQFLPLVIKKILNNRESIERHNLNLRMTEERYRELVQALPDIIYSLDAEGHFVYINDSVRRLGWDPLELVGAHFSTLLEQDEVKRVSREYVLKELKGVATGDQAAPKLFDERRTGSRRTRDLEVRLRHKDNGEHGQSVIGSVIAYGEVNAVGFSAFANELGQPGSLGIIRYVTERKESTRLLQRSIHDKEVLLAEIHHRVKNNLQVISSLLNLQSGGVVDTTALKRFADAQMQIQSMALVHEQLYRSDDYSSVDINTYVQHLCDHLYDAYAVPRDRIGLDIRVDAIPIAMQQAVPVALLLNELISNSLKYAFPDGASGSIHIEISRGFENTVNVEVYDDGVGLPPSFDIAASPTLGHTLVTGLSSQLGGNVTIDGTGGTRFSISFPLEPVTPINAPLD